MRNIVTKEDLEDIVKKSLSIADICRALGYVPIGENYKIIKTKLKLYGISISHFTGKGWNVGNRFREFGRKASSSMIFIENSQYANRTNIKKRLVDEELLEYKCGKCGNIGIWEGNPITLQLEHKNGINDDNRVENLEFLCPNCHSQTKTFAGRNKHKKITLNNKKNKKESKVNLCKCGTPIRRGSKMCVKCHNESQRKCKERPTLEELLEIIKNIGYTNTGKIYGVSDNTVRNWVKNKKR